MFVQLIWKLFEDAMSSSSVHHIGNDEVLHLGCLVLSHTEPTWHPGGDVIGIATSQSRAQVYAPDGTPLRHLFSRMV